MRPGAVDEATLRRMCDAVAHRGPDDTGTEIISGQAALGFRRLSIIDLDTGNQPLHDERRDIAVTCNGEIYNFRELREGLASRGHTFGSHSDVEVIAHLYEENGVGFLDRLEGMFAVALWDAPAERLVLARDRMGVKPLYWARLPDGGVAWGSEPAALFASGLIAPEPDVAAIAAYLTLQYVPPPQSGFAGVQKLAPGERLVWERGALRVERWWNLPDPAQTTDLDDADALDQADELIGAATRERLIADVPLGAFLSGGVDSSLVVGYMAEAVGQVKTFSIDFPDASYSEAKYAREVADLYGTDHHEMTLEADMIATMTDLIEPLGEPLADPSVITTAILSRLTRRHVTVALSGDGGDEAFGGYWRYRRALRARAAGRGALHPLALAGAGVLRHTSRPRLAPARDLLTLASAPQEDIYPTLMSHFRPDQLALLCTPEFIDAAGGVDNIWPAVLALPEADGINAFTALDQRTYLPGALLSKVDRTSMAAALEVRSPLLDRRVHEWAARLTPDKKLRGGDTKWLLKELARRRGLPATIVDRPKKGFGMPVGAWLRGDMREWMLDLLLGERAAGRGWFRRPELEKLIAAHVERRADHSSRLWNLVVLELWLRHFIDRSA